MGRQLRHGPLAAGDRHRADPIPTGVGAVDRVLAGGVVPGVLVLKPDFPENKQDWPFFWGQNEYVVNMTPSYVALVHAAMDLTDAETPGE